MRYISGGTGMQFGFMKVPVGFEGDVMVDGVYRSIWSVVGSQTLGVALDKEFGHAVAVRHNEVSAQMYEHIESVQYRHCNAEFVVNSEDLAVVCESHIIGFKRGMNGQMLSINTTNELIKTSGYMGSVCIWDDDSTSEYVIYSLYGVLGRLCQMCGFSLFKYGVVRLYSPGRGYEVYIKFRNTAEAQRFFAKMYLDVSGGKRMEPWCL